MRIPFLVCFDHELQTARWDQHAGTDAITVSFDGVSFEEAYARCDLDKFAHTADRKIDLERLRHTDEKDPEMSHHAAVLR